MNLSAIYSLDLELLTMFNGDTHKLPLRNMGLEKEADAGVVAEKIHLWAVSKCLITNSEEIAVC